MVILWVLPMALRSLDLNLFVVFDCIYRERHVTRAAETLSVSQPAVSSALRRLRQALDDPLFVPSSEGMMPTPMADNIAADVRKALQLLQRSASASSGFDPATSTRTINLAMTDLAEALLLPELQSLVSAVAPEMQISSYYRSRESAVQALKSGDVDVLLDAPIVNVATLEQQRLAELPHVVANA